MAIFDSEKRPRGLRVPSLTAMKSSAAKSQFSFHSKKSTESVPDDSTPTVKPVPLPKLPPPPNKELPAPPQGLPAIPAPSQLTDNPYFPPIHDVPERRPVQRVPVPVPAPAPASAPSPRTRGMRSKISQPDLRVQEPSPPLESSPAPVPQTVPQIVNDPSPQLEDFIPTPDSADPPQIPSAREEAPSPFVLPEVEPVAPELNKIHLTCYQEHRAMPVAQNTWCPMPCMTCQKFDTEIRHRCVFCCLRVCEGCYQMLQKCKNRSVEELVDRVA
ncbi:uncharacterized protein N7529_001670 [Penicillium soppii]|jgi:hypothetical protein|uniref:uncharacterized protein n=1 Tax=Penicillium soppii TaxID=69789 RepID=UPI002548A528|nr:uncharacterized protein N7529_001670 [Penicillium soppii]KAJ5876086.1 hypothetical protein N7529_001670 [Penicillium soppii]